MEKFERLARPPLATVDIFGDRWELKMQGRGWGFSLVSAGAEDSGWIGFDLPCATKELAAAELVVQTEKYNALRCRDCERRVSVSHGERCEHRGCLVF